MNNLTSPQGAVRYKACTVRNLGLFSLLMAVSLGCSPKPDVPADPVVEPKLLESDVQKASYGVGYNLSRNIKQQMGEVLDADAFVLGVQEAFDGKPMQLTDEQVSAAMQTLQQQKQVAATELGAKNMQQGKEYLAGNAKREGVVTLDSGLQYEILTEGKGEKPAAEDSVTVHYKGTLIDGIVFDSSIARGEPAVFPVNRVIPGWVEALQLMPVGSKWRLFIPPELAYGERGAGADIGPNATLIFDVELLKINPKEQQKEQ